MLLNLGVTTHEGKNETWQFDNETNEVLDALGNLIDSAADERLVPYLRTRGKNPEPGKPVFSNTKTNELRVLKIQLGFKCNMHCRYCAQGDHNIEAYAGSPKEVPAFIEKLKRGNIKVSRNIQLWGGEPFVYWKTIQALVPALRGLYPDIGFSTISNGTLLDEEKIAFCEKYGVSIALSHDGPGYHLRGDDPLDDPKMVDLWRLAIQKCRGNIVCVLTPANTDLEAIKAFFYQKLGDVKVLFEGIMTHRGAPDKELDFTPEQLLTLQKNIYKALTQGAWHEYPMLEMQAQEILRSLAKRKPLDPLAPKCPMRCMDTAAVNLNGDVLSCHDKCTPYYYVGRVENMDKVDLSSHFKSWSDRPECRQCLVLSSCRGACPQMEGVARSLTCPNEFAYLSAIFRAVFWLVFGATINTVEAVKK